MKGLRRILREGRLTSYLMRDRRWLALLVCLLIAALLWFLAALYSPNGYTMEIAVKLEKPNQSLPPSYSITDLEHYPDKITISVHAKGDALMGYTWRHPRHKEISIRPTIDTLLLKSEGGDYIIREQQLKGMIFSDECLPDLGQLSTKTLGNTVKISPEQVSFSYRPLSKDKAEVLFNSQVHYNKHHNLKLVSWEVIPSTIEIYGIRSDLEMLREANQGSLLLYTDSVGIPIERPGCDTVRVAVMIPEGIRTHTDSVDVALTVNELVYHSFTTSDIELRNMPAGYELKLLPEQVTVTYLMPKEQEGQRMRIDPQLYVDVREALDSIPRLLTVLVDGEQPVEMLQIVPDRLDYLLREVEK